MCIPSNYARDDKSAHASLLAREIATGGKRLRGEDGVEVPGDGELAGRVMHEEHAPSPPRTQFVNSGGSEVGRRTANRQQSREILGVDIPASEKTTLIQYEFAAKLGIDSSEAVIEPTGPGSFRVTIPKFIAIGFDDPVFEDPIESSNPLSWLAPPAVQSRMINNILSDKNKQEYISENEAALREQATVFYRSIIASVDPEITTVFEFEE